MLNVIAWCNVFGGFEDPIDEIIACRTDMKFNGSGWLVRSALFTATKTYAGWVQRNDTSKGEREGK